MNKIKKCYICNHDVNKDLEFMSILGVLNTRDKKADKFKITNKSLHICNKCFWCLLCIKDINETLKTQNLKIENNKTDISYLKFDKETKTKKYTVNIIAYFLCFIIIWFLIRSVISM